MATNLVKVTEQTPIVWANSSDYSSTVSGLTRTDQIDLTSIASAGAREGTQKDMEATRWTEYKVSAAFEFASGTVSGETVDIYWAGSPQSTATDANPGGITGTDADYTGTAGDSLTDSLKQLIFIGSLVTTSDNTTVVQYANVGTLSGSGILRYGAPVVVNNSTGALVSNAVEMYIALTPIAPDVQAAV